MQATASKLNKRSVKVDSREIAFTVECVSVVNNIFKSIKSML